MHGAYIEVIAVVEQLHRQFLQLMKLELDADDIYDINNVQALMLFNIGDTEMSVGELMVRGCYLGTNVSYNVKKLTENGYLTRMPSSYDRRFVHIRLTEKGLKLRDKLQAVHQRHVELLNQTDIAEDDLLAAAATLRRLEQFWTGLPERSLAAA